MPPVVRAAHVDDADALGVIHVRAWQAAYRGVMPDEYLGGLRAADRAATWHQHLSAPSADRRLLVIVEDGAVAGFAAIGPERDAEGSSDAGELYAINLDPDVWGRGLGRVLLRHATDQLGQLGYRHVVLWVVPANDRARNLYESEGWYDGHEQRDDEVFGVVVPEMRCRRTLNADQTDARRQVSENDVG